MSRLVCQVYLPTQFSTHGQWWSNLATHRSQTEQCFDLMGFSSCKKKYHISYSLQAFSGAARVPESRLIEAVACVASVPVGLSAGLTHFSLFERAKIVATSPFLPLVLRSPQLSRRQKAKNISNGWKNLRKRLLHRLLKPPCWICKI